MLSRWRAAAWMPLVAYLAATVLGPALHERHHARYGADHEHNAAGTIYHTHDHDHVATPNEQASIADVHARFDDDLVMLDLVEVAEAGTLSVDCTFVEYTMATCAPNEPHAHRFGDQLADPPRRDAAPDLEHHRYSVEHVASPTLIAATPAIVHAVARTVLLSPPALVLALASPRALPQRSRAPPRFLTET